MTIDEILEARAVIAASREAIKAATLEGSATGPWVAGDDPDGKVYVFMPVQMFADPPGELSLTAVAQVFRGLPLAEHFAHHSPATVATLLDGYERALDELALR